MTGYEPHKHNFHHFVTVILPCTAGLLIVMEVLLRTVETDRYSLVTEALANWQEVFQLHRLKMSVDCGYCSNHCCQ